MIGQSLRGFVGQGMNGRRNKFQGYTYQYPPGSYTFTPPQAGYWKFVLWGGGGGGNASGAGAGGGYVEYTRYLPMGVTVALVSGARSVASTATFADGKVLTAGAGATGDPAGAGGVATGGDVNLAGGNTGAAGSGTGAGVSLGEGGGSSANLPVRGGAGGAGSGLGNDPGGGAGSIGAGSSGGGAGLVLVYFVRD